MAFNRAFLLLLHVCSLTCGVWAKVELTMEKSIEVYLHDSAHILCQYHFTDDNTPSLVMIQWFVRAASGKRVRIYYGDGMSQKVDENTAYSDRIAISEQQGAPLIIQNVKLSDDREFICQVNGLAAGTAEGKTHLRVFAPPEAPQIEGVLTGISVTNELPTKLATCEARSGFPKANITWYKDDMPLLPADQRVNLVTRQPTGFYTVQSELQYKVTKEDKDSHFSCEVSFFVPGAVRTAESERISINVHYPTTKVELWKDSPRGPVKEGDTVELRCQGDGNPPPPLVFSRKQETEVGLDSSGGTLVLTEVTRSDTGVYRCRSLDEYDTVTGDVQLTVHYLDPVVMMPKQSQIVFRGDSLVMSCNALSSLDTFTVWFKDGTLVGQGHTLHLQDATYDSSGKYVCKVTVPGLPDLHTTGSVHIIVQGAPQLNDEDKDVALEEAEGRLVNLSCEAHGHPPPTISWNIVGSQSWHEVVVNRANENTAHSVVSVNVTSDVSVLCNASNAMGAEIKAFRIKAIPVVTSAAPNSPDEGDGVLTTVVVLFVLLWATLVLWFLHKKGKMPCGGARQLERWVEL